MNEIVVAEDVRIEDMIHVIRGLQVILDRDLACITSVLMVLKILTKRLNVILKSFQVTLCFN